MSRIEILRVQNGFFISAYTTSRSLSQDHVAKDVDELMVIVRGLVDQKREDPRKDDD